MIGYLLGLLAVARIEQLSGFYIVLSGALLLILFRFKRSSAQLVGFTIAVIYGSLWGYYQLSHRLPDSLGKIDLELYGEVASLVRSEADYQRFEFRLLTKNERQPNLRRVTLSLYQAQPELKQGDRLRLLARLQAPQAYLNPSSPDRRRRALQNRVDATGYVRELHERQPLLSVRQWLYDRLISRFEPSTARFLTAVVLGEGGDLSSAEWALLSRTGTVHLVVVSGLHLGVLAAAGLLFGRLLLILLSSICSRLTPSLGYLPTLFALLVTGLYLWMGGGGLALQRAWVLITLLLVGRLSHRSPDLRARFNWALIVVTLLDPLSVLELGFWLSFGLVWVLLNLNRWRMSTSSQSQSYSVWRGSWQGLIQAFRVQIVLSLMILPALLIALAQLNLVSLFSNLWAIPWVSFGVMLLPLLLPAALLSDPFAQLTSNWVDFFWWGLELNAQMGLSPEWVPPPILFVPLAFFGMLLLLMPLRLRWVGFLLLLPALQYQHPEMEGFKVNILDVGQGQAAIIDLPTERWVYDTGAAFGSGFAVANLTLVPTLKRRPDLSLTGLIVSHGDRDHSGGVAALLAYTEPETRLSGQPNQVLGQPCSEGFERKIEGVQFRVGGLTEVRSDNDASCWLFVQYRDCSLLIAGDMSVSAEHRLMSELKQSSLTWLHLSHHGSKSSTSSRWLDYWTPTWALNSSGRNNHFGHPHPEVRNRLEERNIPLLDTAAVGAVYLIASSQGCKTETFLERQLRYWH